MFSENPDRWDLKSIGFCTVRDFPGEKVTWIPRSASGNVENFLSNQVIPVCALCKVREFFVES